MSRNTKHVQLARPCITYHNKNSYHLPGMPPTSNTIIHSKTPTSQIEISFSQYTTMNNLQRPSAKDPSHRPVKIPFFPQAGNKYDRSTNFEASVYSSSCQSSHTRNYHHDHHQHSIYISMHVPAAHTPISELQLIVEGINEDEPPPSQITSVSSENQTQHARFSRHTTRW